MSFNSAPAPDEDSFSRSAGRKGDGMAVYQYRCSGCGVFDVVRPMGTASTSERCMACGSAAPRSYSAPYLNRTPRPLADALTKAEKSREQPEVVDRVPPGRRPPRPMGIHG